MRIRVLLLLLLSLTGAGGADTSWRMAFPHDGQSWFSHGGEWQELTASRVMAPGDAVRTTEASHAYVDFQEGHRIWLTPQSVLNLVEANVYELSAGEVRAELLDGAPVAVQTPIVRVAGSDAEFSVALASRGVYVNVFRGSVAVGKDVANAPSTLLVTSGGTIKRL